MSDTEASFLELHLSNYIGWFVKTKIYDKRDDFDFDIVFFFPFLARNPVAFIFLNLFDLLKCPVMLMNLILVIRF